MSLSARVKKLSSNHKDAAKPMMESMEKSLKILDDALYNKKEDLAKTVMDGIFKGVAAGMVGDAIGKITESTPPNQQTYAEYQDSIASGHIAYYKQYCRHNDDPETRVWDIIEHIGNREFGDAARDLMDNDTFNDAVRDALETIGNEILKED
jgi:hypothetical protein